MISSFLITSSCKTDGVLQKACSESVTNPAFTSKQLTLVKSFKTSSAMLVPGKQLFPLLITVEQFYYLQLSRLILRSFLKEHP